MGLGLMNFFGGGEDLMEDTRDQNSDDLGADEHLTSSKARLEKYLQKQWQLGKRKLQVQVDFGNVPLEWEYLNQYHGVRHPLAMTAFGPKYGLAGPPPPMYDYGYGPVQQGGLPMPSHSSANKRQVLGSSNSVLLLCSNLKLQSSRVRRLFSNQRPLDRM